jgi:hypothetical protein
MDKTSSTFALQPFFERTQLVNLVIDTPKAAPFKLKFDEEAKVFRVHKAMPLGIVFPFNFGFVPSTRGSDGEPLDVLLLTDFCFADWLGDTRETNRRFRGGASRSEPKATK